MSKAPAFQWYAADYLADERVAQLTLEAEGAQFRAIMHAAMNGDKAFLAKFPFVGRLTMNDSKATARPAIPMAVRRRVLAAGCCALCGSTKRLEVDHIVPYSKGGAHEESNFQCLCFCCNRAKASKMEGSL